MMELLQVIGSYVISLEGMMEWAAAKPLELKWSHLKVSVLKAVLLFFKGSSNDSFPKRRTRTNNSRYFQGIYSYFIIIRSQSVKLGGKASCPGGALTLQKDPRCRNTTTALCMDGRSLNVLLLTPLSYLGAKIDQFKDPVNEEISTLGGGVWTF